VVPELHHHGAVPEPRSELEPFRLPEGTPEASEPDHGETAEPAAGQPATAAGQPATAAGQPATAAGQPAAAAGQAAAAAGQAAEPDCYPFAAALVPVPAVPLDQLTPPVPSGIAAIESMLAGTELSMVGCGEEEAW
jgi:hypothetical protein